VCACRPPRPAVFSPACTHRVRMPALVCRGDRCDDRPLLCPCPSYLLGPSSAHRLLIACCAPPQVLATVRAKSGIEPAVFGDHAVPSPAAAASSGADTAKAAAAWLPTTEALQLARSVELRSAAAGGSEAAGARARQQASVNLRLVPTAQQVAAHPPTTAAAAGRPASAGAGGDNGIAKMWNRREISVSSYYDQSHYLHPHPWISGPLEPVLVGLASAGQGPVRGRRVTDLLLLLLRHGPFLAVQVARNSLGRGAGAGQRSPGATL
jgi:hypothetical protein